MMSTLAESQQTQEMPHAGRSGHGAAATLGVCLPSMPAEGLAAMVAGLAEIFPGEALVIASPDQAEEQPVGAGGTSLVPYPVQRTESEWVLNANDYATAARLTQQRGLAGVLLLGPEAGTLDPQAIRNLRQTIASGVDLVLPRYITGPQEGLVNTALLYPLTRALFSVDVRFPLPLDAGLSARMLARLDSAAVKGGVVHEDGLVWPVAEAAIAGYTVRQVEGVERSIPRPQEADLNVLFPAVTSSLFSDLESKAAFWQRARTSPTGRTAIPQERTGTAVDREEIQSLVEGFRLAFSNLREIWSLVLPPQSLLALKKLSISTPESFQFPPSLWARVVYDFALAYRLRTLNRGHLLGAMTPLYLAWVAGFLRASGRAGAETLVETTAAAFEQEKPYLVSRWRWPDRFNP